MVRTRATPQGAFARHLDKRFAGLSLEEIAEAVGMRTGVVSRHLAGTVSPKALSVLRYAAALHEHPADLHDLLGEDEMARLYRDLPALVPVPSADALPQAADPVADHVRGRVDRLLGKGLSRRLRLALDELDGLRGQLKQSFRDVIEGTGAEAAFLASDSLPAADTVLLRFNVAPEEAEALHRRSEDDPVGDWACLSAKSGSSRLYLYLRGASAPETAQMALNLWPSAFF